MQRQVERTDRRKKTFRGREDDPNYYVSNGYFFILYEVVSA